MTLAQTGVVDARRRNNVKVSGNPAGRAIVFAHGFGCSQEVWRDVVPFFEHDYRVVQFDHVGAGASDASAYDRGKYDSLHGYAADLLEILEAEHLTDVVYVGHSVSSMIGVLAANRDSSRFGALVLVGPSPRYINDDGYVGGFEQADIDGLLDSLDANYLGWSAAMAPVIDGQHRPPGAGARPGRQLLQRRPGDRQPVRSGDIPLRQPARPRRGDRADAGASVHR